jgi:hypothetical protein
VNKKDENILCDTAGEISENIEIEVILKHKMFCFPLPGGRKSFL